MLGLMSPQAIKREARAKATTAAHLWEMPGDVDSRRDDVQDACIVSGVNYPASQWGVFPEMLKTESPEWWGRQLKKADKRELEYSAMKAGKIDKYCSAEIAQARQKQKEEMREMLARLLAVCELPSGETVEKELLELVESSNANPAIRRMELMARIRGFENYAKAQGHVAYFLTATCPSRFHRNSGNRWKGASPRQAQEYMCGVWAKNRAQLNRMKIEMYGFRIAEPHKDACPHWHMLFWFKSHHEARQAITAMRAAFLADTPTEEGAQRRRFTTKRIDAKKGSATGYVAKYICKNVDGRFDDKGLIRRFEDERRNRTTGKMERTGMTSEEAALRVEAWAACWGIRQFQQIGGPKVGVWRELRRLRTEYKGEGAELIEPLRAAADAGQWDLFAELDEQHRGRFGKRVRILAETSADKLQNLQSLDDEEAVRACLNVWQEPTLREVKGVKVGWVAVKTRWLKWTLMIKKALEGKSKREAEREFISAFKEKIFVARREAWPWVEPTGAAPPGALEFCQ